jgi:hypothetical protein
MAGWTVCKAAIDVLGRRRVRTREDIEQLAKGHFRRPRAMIATGNEVSRLEQRCFIDEDYLVKYLPQRGHAGNTT